MERDVRTYLWDAQQAAAAIEAFVAGLDAKTYAETEIVRAAVERKFEIIGEALNRLAKQDPTFAARIPDLAKIVAFRNLLIHGYANVEHDRVWQVARVDLPILAACVSALLDELGPPGQ